MHYTRGRVTRQAHVDIPSGTVEEEFGRGGFFGRAAHLYRSAPPVNWSSVSEGLRPRAMNLRELGGLNAGEGQPREWLDSRIAVLENSDARIAFSRLTGEMQHCFRNADADELLFVHAGRGTLLSDFGALDYETGDYLLIPRGTTYRLAPKDLTHCLVLESRGELKLPEKGLLGHHALFDPALIDVPDPERLPANLNSSSQREWDVVVQRGGEQHLIRYPFDPLNTVGWKGDLSVWRVNVKDIRPVLSDRYHLPPSAHATFLSDSLVVCTFLPRPLEVGDPNALRVPFYHANIDYDEVLFYHAGDFFSRQGISPGMLTFHPQGIHHGPQPGAVKASEGKTRTEEVAVMIDTMRPLRVCDGAQSAERVDYWKSWMTP
ncbi:MAG: homogentisate 1,2-dioxygenase [Polyangiaceae bacterium]